MRRRLIVYSVCHFLVDLSCALLLLGRIAPHGDAARLLLFYDFFAFAVQMPIGVLADEYRRPHYTAALGCVLTALAWLLPGMAGAVCAGLGNALFHIGGGQDTLESHEKCAALGIFVSPGAFGIYFGGVWAFRASSLTVPAILVLLLAALLILRLCAVEKYPMPDCPPEQEALTPALVLTLGCLTLVVVLRSLLGSLFDFPWKAALGPAMTCAVVLGKALGGVLSDRFGLRRTAAVSLLLAALLFVFSDSAPAGLAAVFLFNMTMPMTLWGAARRLPTHKSFAFGLLTFALFLGILPVFLDWAMPPALLTCLAGTLLSLPLLLIGVREVV